MALDSLMVQELSLSELSLKSGGNFIQYETEFQIYDANNALLGKQIIKETLTFSPEFMAAFKQFAGLGSSS